MFGFNPAPKPQPSVRVKPTQRQMGAISAKVDRELKERSGGVCERCKRARAAERAHLIRRGKLTHRTTVRELAHLCTPCHRFADESGTSGREWARKFSDRL